MTRISGSSERYKTLVWTLCRKSRYTKALAEVVMPAEAEALSGALVRIGMHGHSIMPIVYSLIEYEFEQSKNEPTTVFRNNSLGTKFIGAYIRKIGQAYMQAVLSPLIRSVAGEPYSYEMDPRRLAEGEDSEVNRQHFAESVQTFVKHVCDPDTSVSAMPYEMRLIGRWISDFALANKWNASPLVGGYIFLRLMNPAIVSPETFDLIGPGVDISMRARRNLVLISKMLQNLANGVDFKKEPYMECMNPLLAELQPLVQTFLLKMVSNPAASAPAVPKPMEPTFETAEDVDLRQYDIKDLITVHALIVQYADRLISFLQQESLRDDSTGSSAIASDREFLDLVKQLGPVHRKATDMGVGGPDAASSSAGANSPTSSSASGRRQSTTKAPPGTARSGQSLANQSQENDADSELDITPLDQLREFSYSHLRKLDVDLSKVEATNFFFSGPKTKSGIPVFYMILSKLTTCNESLVSDLNMLAMYIIRVLGDAVNSAFNVIVDCSWNNIPLSKQLFRQILPLSRLFARKHKKNLQAVYLVHPVAFSRAISWFVKNFSSAKSSRKKIFEVYDWRELRSIIDLDQIALPEESKHSIARSYRVVKVNSKGKRQVRLIKLTAISILNIDPKTQCIKNERLLSEIASVDENDDGDVVIHFNLAAEPEPEIGFFPCTHSTDDDLAVRRYVMQNAAERKELIDDIMDAAFHSGSLQYSQAFLYRKTAAKKGGLELSIVGPSPPPDAAFSSTLGPVELNTPVVVSSGERITRNRSGSETQLVWEIGKNERILKITVDSILLIDKSTIQLEVHFCSVESVFADAAQPNVVWLKFMGEDSSRRLLCAQAKELVGAVQQAITNFRQQKLRIEQDAELDGLAYLSFGSPSALLSDSHQ
eukprot:ANDGO_05793.mRNA.1 Neurofibromin-A